MATPHPFSQNPFKTRTDLQSACISLLQPLANHTSPGGARIKLGHTGTHYDDIAAQLEGFSRPLWGLSALLAGGGELPEGQNWVSGLESGTDPDGEEFWGWSRAKDQRMVEMAAIGYSLAIAPEQLWKPLSEKGKTNLAAWLGAINDKEMPDTNWLWFRVFANLGLAKVGAPHSPERMKADLDHLDTFYLGDGWSPDGPEGVRQLDYYSSSYAIHYAQLVYSKLAQDSDPERYAEYRNRGSRFALDFVHYFDEQGRAIPFGRSMTYRFAMAAFWGALAFADVQLPSPLGWGVVKGLLLRNLRWWSKQAIFNSDGTMPIGFVFPNMYMTENYNSPGSPYWCMKAFIPLSLPESHPFWSTPEEPYPQSLPFTVALDHPSHIITRLGGHTFLLSSGQACHYPLRHTAEKYGKFAYSSAFGFSVPTGNFELEQQAADSMLALSDDGERWRVRRLALNARIEVDDGVPVLRSSWKPWPDVEVETWLHPPRAKAPNWHWRVHRLRTARKIQGADGGFAIYGQGKDGRALPGFLPETGEGRIEGGIGALAASSAGVSAVLDISPSHARTATVVNVDANANIMATRTVLPTLMSHHEPHEDVWLVTAVFAIPAKEDNSAPEGWLKAWEEPPALPRSIKSRVHQGH
ncbi:hypothetical protein DACRYDRAFT_80824 [Dacryopinax primogenitus]|uniref:DUF2264 domain-containing protein n=1 Tax=Dacryopinax primogenitus (strain DJM 731) TaxID=1858805 RepID=M5G433_DACPD|nr:uncharacterized protein DACRYDRAFT_80824 [Dacryopinax primogenitus]EJU00597.1 hypothetical protein DACRYDRAFT_80824 [Dacryopinax primogenitus]